MQVRILILITQPAPAWQQVGPIEIPSSLWGASVPGGEQLVDAMFDGWLRQVRAQYPGVRVLVSFDGGDWREW